MRRDQEQRYQAQCPICNLEFAVEAGSPALVRVPFHAAYDIARPCPGVEARPYSVRPV
ncbi:MAG: hypothetical protein HY689_01680 [Chloroflexi bacterium]|nr:hypothetical protein [Chloroflexota bacterium]